MAQLWTLRVDAARSRLTRGVGSMSAALLFACAPAGEPMHSVETESLADSDAAAPPPPEPERCAAPPGISSAPSTIAGAVSLINALPKPVTLACFVQSLARPLHAMATSSPFSAQPAAGAGNPRLFLFSGESLILSVVPAGVGRDLLELSELTSVSRSVKAEIPFPVAQDVTDEALVEQIARSGGSVCALCHAIEIPAAGDDFFAGALESDALRPVPDYDVDLSTMLTETEQCDRSTDAARCELLDALFAPGDVVHRPFPEAMRTFF